MKGITSKFLLALACSASVPLACDSTVEPGPGGAAAAGGQKTGGAGGSSGKASGGLTGSGGSAAAAGAEPETGGSGGQSPQSGGSSGATESGGGGGVPQGGESSGGITSSGGSTDVPPEGGATQGGSTASGGGGGVPEPSLCDQVCDLAMQAETCQGNTRESCVNWLCGHYAFVSLCRFDLVQKCWAASSPDWFVCNGERFIANTTQGSPCFETYNAYLMMTKMGGSCAAYEDEM